MEYVPWSSGVSAISYVSLMLSGSDAQDDIDAYVEGKAEHLFELLGYDSVVDDTYQDLLLRSLALDLLCGYDYPDCRDRAVTDFDSWRQAPLPDADGANPIDSEVRDTAYCTAIRNGDTVRTNKKAS